MRKGLRKKVDCRDCFYITTLPIYVSDGRWQWYSSDAYYCNRRLAIVRSLNRYCRDFTDKANLPLGEWLEGRMRIETHD